MFDTQIAAQVCGFGEAVSYENLVKGILNIELDKTCRLSNWSIRPLEENQLKYAISDVTHLVHIYENLRTRLAETGRLHWLERRNSDLINPETYLVNPQEVWQKSNIVLIILFLNRFKRTGKMERIESSEKRYSETICH